MSYCSTAILVFTVLSHRPMALDTIARHELWFNTISGSRPGHDSATLTSQPLQMRTNCLKQGDIRVCQRQCPSRKQAEGSGATRRAFAGKVIQSEFKYNEGTEIFGETEPADYVYQVADGAVRSHKLLSDGRRQIGAFHLAATFSGWRTEQPTDLPRKRSSTRPSGW